MNRQVIRDGPLYRRYTNIYNRLQQLQVILTQSSRFAGVVCAFQLLGCVVANVCSFNKESGSEVLSISSGFFGSSKNPRLHKTFAGSMHWSAWVFSALFHAVGDPVPVSALNHGSPQNKGQ